MIANRQLFLNHIAQTSTAPLMLEFERAEGLYLYSSDGKKYTDLIAGIAVSNVGHSHPQVVKAVKEQAEKYMHLMVYGEFVESPQVKYATALTQHLPAQLNNVYFTNSGAEATEGAMKLAKRFTGRQEIVSFKNAYHGSTQGALSVMGDEALKQKYRPLLPGITQINFDDENDLAAITTHTAAVIVETAQAEVGVKVPAKGFMQKLRARCNETGALLILDEIQVGMGRSGKLFAFEHYGIVPDILLLAKALGGGMPLGAFIAAKEIMGTLAENPALGHITTFGGHPVCCAAGLAAFEVLHNENLFSQVEEKGRLFDTLLMHPKIKAKRRFGLLMALEFESFEENKLIIDRCIEKGVLTDWFLFAPHCMRIAPPLIISPDEIQQACEVILSCLD
ncbi:MAG TPA: aminotransferase class III-fold pyridoxal phosphate-dependent enzyme [Chitinophagales bacterium]|nr:aminotransferase class III-fold pyridoxal phosphate-dependent enzyme [Chitinophagales bacterium]